MTNPIFTTSPILVLGDIILDEYIHGTVTRVSPEAPVPVVRVKSREYRLGGAANVAANIKALGGTAVVCGVINDQDFKKIHTLFREKGLSTEGLVLSKRMTTLKSRVIGNEQQIARLDDEDTSQLTAIDVAQVEVRMDTLFKKPPVAVIISDYAKGVIDQRVLEHLQAWNAPRYLDPKTPNKEIYKTLRYEVVTPNLDEAAALTGAREITDPLGLEECGRRLLTSAIGACNYALITKGPQGMSLFSKKGATHITPHAREVFDVSGAGDTVMAALTLASVSGLGMQESAYIASLAAGIVVEKQGTAVATYDELVSRIQDEPKPPDNAIQFLPQQPS